MTKQEEIREGIAKIIYNYTSSTAGDELCPEELLWYLHENGVVIKVRKKLPLVDGTFADFSECGHPFNFHEGYYKAQKDMRKWHKDSLEPLIKEE